VLVGPPTYVLYVDGATQLETADDRVGATGTIQSMTATGTRGVIALFEMRVHQAR
jgi:hypothetical protein